MEHSENQFFELRFEDLNPYKIRASDTAKLISNFELIMTELMAKNDSSLKKNDIVMGLVGKEGSTRYFFNTYYRVQAVFAYSILTDAIKKMNFDDLTTNSIESLKKIHAISRSNNSSIGL